MTHLMAADFGISGDGVTDSTDGFLALHARLLSDRERMWRVEFQPGHYLTRASHWLTNVGRVMLVGYGASLQHMVANKGLFSPHEPFRHLVSSEPFPAPQVFEHHPGYRIGTVEAGATTVRFLDGVTPPEAKVGTAVLIGGLNQQLTNEDPPRSHGWPPNLRFFEFGTIREVGDGFVRLVHTLGHSYDETWTDYDGDYFGPYRAGAPRLYLANRSGFDIPKHIEMRGFRFLRAIGSTRPSAGGVGLPAALSLTLEDCVIQDADQPPLGAFVQICDRAVFRRCTVQSLEIDKNLRHVLIDDCDMGSVFEGGDSDLSSRGAGCELVEVRNSRVYGDLAINPRSVILENVTAHRNVALSAQHGGYYDTHPFTVSTRATRP